MTLSVHRSDIVVMKIKAAGYDSNISESNAPPDPKYLMELMHCDRNDLTICENRCATIGEFTSSTLSAATVDRHLMLLTARTFC